MTVMVSLPGFESLLMFAVLVETEMYKENPKKGDYQNAKFVL
jgi:hypothetical protein